MNKNSRQAKREQRRREARQRRVRRIALVLGVVAVVVGVTVAVRATGAGGGAGIHLYQDPTGSGTTTIHLSDVVGQGEPTIVNFWASNCPPCRMEMPGFQKVYAEHGGEGYRMLGVDVGPQTGLGTHAGARSLVQRLGIGYAVGYAEGDTLVQRYGLRGMPTTLFFDASGHQVGRVTGYLSEPDLRKRLAGLLASNP